MEAVWKLTSDILRPALGDTRQLAHASGKARRERALVRRKNLGDQKRAAHVLPQVVGVEVQVRTDGSARVVADKVAHKKGKKAGGPRAIYFNKDVAGRTAVPKATHKPMFAEFIDVGMAASALLHVPGAERASAPARRRAGTPRRASRAATPAGCSSRPRPSTGQSTPIFHVSDHRRLCRHRSIC